jgi:hypothetical protein
LARLKPDLAALPRSKVVQLNVEVHQAVSIIMGALPAVQALRPQIARVRARQGDAESVAPSVYPGRPGRRAPRRKSAAKVTP